jgi:hypothetical protein
LHVQLYADRVIGNQPTSNLAKSLVDCLPHQSSDQSTTPK